MIRCGGASRKGQFGQCGLRRSKNIVGRQDAVLPRDVAGQALADRAFVGEGLDARAERGERAIALERLELERDAPGVAFVEMSGM